MRSIDWDSIVESMTLPVEHVDSKGNTRNLRFKLSKLALLKHMAFAGLGNVPRLKESERVIAKFYSYNRWFMKSSDFVKNRFSTPPDKYYDQFGKTVFSNEVGTAIADFLAKKIYNSLYTSFYEAAMKIKGKQITGNRPDLISFTKNKNNRFAIEAKGFGKQIRDPMKKYKKQSQSGPIDVNFSIASVSYQLYSNILCKYHDPVDNEIQFNDDLLKNLSREYYRNLLSFFDDDNIEYREEFSSKSWSNFNEQFIKVKVRHGSQLESRLKESIRLTPNNDDQEIDCQFLYLIFPEKIREYAQNGLDRSIEPFRYDHENWDYFYVDNDRIGLQVETR